MAAGVGLFDASLLPHVLPGHSSIDPLAPWVSGSTHHIPSTWEPAGVLASGFDLLELSFLRDDC